MTEAINAAALRCAGCGGNRLAWRVKRVVTPGHRASERTLIWSCRDCGGESVSPTGCAEETPLPAPGV